MKYINLETGQGIRTKNLIVRITPEEKRILFKEAQKLGISISAFVRLLLRDWLGDVQIKNKKSDVDEQGNFSVLQ